MLALSANQRYLIKTIPRVESKQLRRMLPRLLAHLEGKSGTSISCMLALFRVKWVRLAAPQASKVYITISEAAFPAIPGAAPILFDLKGSSVSRTGRRTSGEAEPADKGEDGTLGVLPERTILKDNDLRQALCDAPGAQASLLSWEQDTSSICDAIARDAELLASLRCMDYSLLVAFVPEDAAAAQEYQQQLEPSYYLSTRVTSGERRYIAYCRIIDILCPWSPKKRLAQVTKIALGKPPDGLSTAPPTAYKGRFISFVAERLFSRTQNTTPALRES
uniref:PIPK domain-containing protein n=1 Tax=Phaeomonas parva TaxID=124430 RepID=A0A7S1XX54_9STRA|mmetsp:Transcript_5650/g.15800  ORF Transcript_5650/g.15800 Transcript_5650/m.15800 type:complete len:277 (+) Transcript_5650:533-1363(+)